MQAPKQKASETVQRPNEFSNIDLSEGNHCRAQVKGSDPPIFEELSRTYPVPISAKYTVATGSDQPPIDMEMAFCFNYGDWALQK